MIKAKQFGETVEGYNIPVDSENIVGTNWHRYRISRACYRYGNDF